MKVFISFDYEGIGGTVSWEEMANNQTQNFLATEQINSYCKGIYGVCPDAEIYICDSHSFGRNILWEGLLPGIKLIRGYPRKKYMMEGLDESFSHLVLFGYHAPVGFGGLMEHTYSSSSIYDIAVNGNKVDEALINCYLASHYKVPLNFVYCDQTCADFLSEKTVNTHFLISKKVISRYAAIAEPYEALKENLYQKGMELKSNKGDIIKEQLPGELEIQFTDNLRAYMCSIIPGSRKKDARTLVFDFTSFEMMYQYLMACVFICSGAANIK